MSSQQFQIAHDSIKKTGNLLLQYMREIRAGKLTEGEDTKGLENIENDVKNALEALETQKFQVAVIAAMKAGKSTFLNALIGADILASESEACTVCRTDIRPINNQQIPKLLEYREGHKKPVILIEGEAEIIRQKFLERTHQIREKHNQDQVIKFELEHPIEAITKLPSLAGFTLVDTPGPNEWETVQFNTVALKKTALEALRTCNAILFILDYSSFKDNTNSELLTELIEQRKEALQQNTGKLYFILNKVDRKSEKDRSIDLVIEDLKKALIGFGIPQPIIYPTSAWQGLLGKLLVNKRATESHKKDFNKFFVGQYLEYDDFGFPRVPENMLEMALEDSNIITIQESVIQTVVQNSGWNLLNDVLSKIDKTAKSMEDNLNTQISGWEIEFENLKDKIQDYQKCFDDAQEKVEKVKTSVEDQKQILIKGFTQGVGLFAQEAKLKIETEIKQIASSQSVKQKKIINKREKNENKSEIIPDHEQTKFGFSLPFFGGISFSFETKKPLIETLRNIIPDFSNKTKSNSTQVTSPFKIRVQTEEEGKKIVNAINEYCTPHLQTWWLDTQDKLVRDGTKIREELVQKIQQDIQVISDELSKYLGESLDVELNVNPIQFPDFEFIGIDAKVQQQIEVFERGRKVTKYREETQKSNSFCKKDKIYTIPYQATEYVQDSRTVYEVDLLQTAHDIKENIDAQASGTQMLLERVISKQIEEDFHNAEQQINNYIQQFQELFNNLLNERETREGEREQIIAKLESQKAKLNEYLSEIQSLKISLSEWKPI